jgi:hypothetical protein
MQYTGRQARYLRTNRGKRRGTIKSMWQTRSGCDEAWPQSLQGSWVGATMRWWTAILLVLGIVTTGFAGTDPYIAVVGNDIYANGYYFSPNHEQFLYDQERFFVPACWGSYPVVTPQTRVGGLGCEQFRCNKPMNQPEICDPNGQVNGPAEYIFYGDPNAVIRKQNAGYFEWWVRLPKRPSGQINIVIQCGVLKPNAFAFEQFDAVRLCAAETGERIGAGFCTRDSVDPGMNPIINSSLPKLTAIAYPGPYSLGFAPFHLTAYKNPGTYALPLDPAGIGLENGTSLQVLDGSANSRVLLKSCMEKSIPTKIPVMDQVNALGELEAGMEAADLIQVRLDIPINNTVDIYCHSRSVRLQGIGEDPY